MSEEEARLQQERQELNALIGKGVSFEVKDIEFETVKRWGFIKRHIPKEVTRRFTINEPTLATLDRLSSEWIEFAIDEEVMRSSDGMVAARRYANKHCERCARVVAIAVLGEDRLVAVPGKGGTRWIEDEAELERLTRLFLRTIKPSRLYQLYVLINTMCNLGDFLNSIRLMSTDRTTMPNPIEQSNVG